MQIQAKVFACGRAMVLGALYDTAEKLKWKLLSANSDAGILVVAERKTGMPFLVRASPERDGKVEVTVELASGEFSGRDSPEEAACFLETMAQIIEDALAAARRHPPLKE